MGKNKKKRVDVVYSTNPNFDYDYEGNQEEETLEPSEQMLKLLFEKKGRGGKTVSIVSGFVGSSDDLDSLAKDLKSGLGTGGSVKDGEILIQGDRRKDLKEKLQQLGYSSKMVGG
jgi:translation initiation factor 1